MDLNSPVTSIPKIGPKYKALLEKLEIRTVGDLVYHFPFRYQDFTQIKKVSDLMINDVATVRVELERVDNIFTRNGRRLTKAVFSDETGKIQVMWFNMHYIKNNLKVGEIYSLSGKVGSFSGKISFVAPELEEVGSKLNTGRLVPIYPETAGVSSKWLRTRINDILNSGLGMEEFLPENILKTYKFVEFEKALKNIHFPKTIEEAVEAKRRFAYEELFLELLKVEDRKSAWKKELTAATLKLYRDEIDKLIKSLPFKLSESQKAALEAIFADLGSNHPMNRLLEGDVGSGKTVVAITSAWLTHLNGLKTLYMAPTEILAQQHYETFKSLLSPFGVKVQLKTSASKASVDDADVIVGTHALIHIEEKIKNVGLIVVDEQHRFGVEQRGKLLELGSHEAIPHLLTMTATPIPRTLALTIYGDLEISKIELLEKNRKNIKTWILTERKREDAFKWVAKQNLPTFVICPLIEESEHETLESVKAAEAEYEKLKSSYFKGHKIGLLHGRMNSKKKLKVIADFRSGKIKILVATPVIEVGIDVPDASIIVIESAERYGLASLHQLRGRVGRAGQQAYCLVFTSKRGSAARLKNLAKYDSGIKLAEIDMQTRGQGDLYGTAQHGFANFKVADLSDLQLLEEAKTDAADYLPQVDEFPKLKERLEHKTSNLVSQN